MVTEEETICCVSKLPFPSSPCQCKETVKFRLLLLPLSLVLPFLQKSNIRVKGYFKRWQIKIVLEFPLLQNNSIIDLCRTQGIMHVFSPEMLPGTKFKTSLNMHCLFMDSLINLQNFKLLIKKIKFLFLLLHLNLKLIYYCHTHSSVVYSQGAYQYLTGLKPVKGVCLEVAATVV